MSFSLDSKLCNDLVIFNDQTYVLKARFQLRTDAMSKDLL